MPARKCLKGVHPAEQHASILGIFLGLKEALEALLADHHQSMALCKPDKGGEMDKELWAVHHLKVARSIKTTKHESVFFPHLSKVKVVLCSKQGLLLSNILLVERNTEDRVSKTVASLSSLQPRHDVMRIWCGADEEAALAEVLGGVAEHAVGLGKALKAVVERKLAADEVKLLIWVLVEVSRSLFLHHTVCDSHTNDRFF